MKIEDARGNSRRNGNPRRAYAPFRQLPVELPTDLQKSPELPGGNSGGCLRKPFTFRIGRLGWEAVNNECPIANLLEPPKSC